MADSPTSTRPYMIRAWHEWCTDNHFTPYLLVRVDHTVVVPREFVQQGEIVLNIDLDATGGLSLGNEEIRFKARFSGKVREIIVPVERVQAIYARENGQGMGFEVEEHGEGEEVVDAAEVDENPAAASAGPERAGLSVVSKSAPAEPVSDKDDEPPTDPSPPPAKGGGLRVVK